MNSKGNYNTQGYSNNYNNNNNDSSNNKPNLRSGNVPLIPAPRVNSSMGRGSFEPQANWSGYSNAPQQQPYNGGYVNNSNYNNNNNYNNSRAVGFNSNSTTSCQYPPQKQTPIRYPTTTSSASNQHNQSSNYNNYNDYFPQQTSTFQYGESNRSGNETNHSHYSYSNTEENEPVPQFEFDKSTECVQLFTTDIKGIMEDFVKKSVGNGAIVHRVTKESVGLIEIYASVLKVTRLTPVICSLRVKDSSTKMDLGIEFYEEPDFPFPVLYSGATYRFIGRLLSYTKEEIAQLIQTNGPSQSIYQPYLHCFSFQPIESPVELELGYCLTQICKGNILKEQ